MAVLDAERIASLPREVTAAAALLVCTGLLFPALASPPPESARPSATEIIQRLRDSNREREQQLGGYQVSRRYHLRNELTSKEAAMQVEVAFRAPDELEFEIREQEGSGFLARRVFGRMMEGEQESLGEEKKRQSAMTPENYQFHLEGEEKLEGRPAYRIRITPQREDTFLFEGLVWVDAVDFAVVRAAGSVVKRPSFWTRKIEFVRTFKKVGPFWLPARTESTTEVLLFGTSWVTIENGDYRIRLRGSDSQSQP